MVSKKSLAVSAAIALSIISTGALAQGESAEADKPTTVTSPFEHEAVVIPLEPGWQMANTLKAGDSYTLQFLPPGQTAKNFDQILNVTTYKGAQRKATALKFMETTKEKMLGMKEAKVDWNIISATDPNDVIYEYVFTGNTTFPSQYEVTRVITGKDGLHTVVHHRPKASVTPSEREQMINSVKRISLKPVDAKTKS